MLLTDWVNLKKKTPNIIVRFVSRRTTNNVYKKRKKLKDTDLVNLITESVFINVNFTKSINTCFTWLMKEENNLTGNTCGPTVGEFTLDKAVIVKQLISTLKKTLNISKKPWSIKKVRHWFAERIRACIKHSGARLGICLVGMPSSFSNNICAVLAFENSMLHIEFQGSRLHRRAR